MSKFAALWDLLSELEDAIGLECHVDQDTVSGEAEKIQSVNCLMPMASYYEDQPGSLSIPGDGVYHKPKPGLVQFRLPLPASAASGLHYEGRILHQGTVKGEGSLKDRWSSLFTLFF